MNTYRPLSHSLEKVDFSFLTPEEIRALSVRRVENPETFDSLQNPVPGGLYDPALGAWDNYWCSTCSLNPFECPGHPGHIELPLPVFHCLFLDQIHVLLNGKCDYCHFFRLPATEIHVYTCKLKLLKHGLLEASRELDNVSIRATSGELSDEDDDADDDKEMLIAARDKFTRKAIRDARRNHGVAGAAAVESVLAERRAVTKELFANLRKGGSKCKRCSGISRKWRKDRANRMYRKPLGVKDAEKTRAIGRKPEEPLLVALRAAKIARKERQTDREMDEAIAMETDSIHENEQAEAEAVALLEKELVETGLYDANAQEAEMLQEDASTAKADQLANVKEVHAHLEILFERERNVLEMLYGSNEARSGKKAITPDRFFIHTLLVPPNRYRPSNNTAGAGLTEAEENNLYRTILDSSNKLRTLQETLLGKAVEKSPSTYRKQNYADFQNEWIRLQDSVNALFDSNLSTVRKKGVAAAGAGVKQKLEKKEGLFRMNMMGKRVNFAARSVISPDPNIETNEIGVPPVFAKKLTFAEPVTTHNIAELKEAVINGYYKWPGAAAIESETGELLSLQPKSPAERQALANQLLAPSSSKSTGAKNKKVHRHLNNGDMVIMNRQPTLHKPSMMCHRARVLPGEKTIRMHYANTKTYNADFDGDEMNMHFPQNEVGRAEALTIADTDHQYIVPTAGQPLRGLIQDHISLGVWLTNRDTLFTRSEYNQLIYNSLRPESGHTSSERIRLIGPAIIKPRKMWTGKQVISTLLMNITPASSPGLTFTGRSKLEARFWEPKSEEQDVIFRDSELLCGILDNNQLGPSNKGFVHAAYEAYGHTAAGKLLSALGRLLTNFANMRALSCGMEDIVLSKVGDEVRRTALAKVSDIGTRAAANYVKLEDCSGPEDIRLRQRLEEVLRDDSKQLRLELSTISEIQKFSRTVKETCMPVGLFKPFPYNNMQTMTESKAKGSNVNANSISCTLDQQVLEGRRVPIMVSGKTLPCFKPFETKTRAGGHVTDRFLSGLRPQEYYFHAMSGREGLIDTAVKTSRSGYLQRCVIKGMEGLKVEYDSSVRDADGTIVQFLSGEDGLDVTKQTYLSDFTFLAQNFSSILAQMNAQEGFEKLLEDDAASKWNKKALKQIKKNNNASMDPALAHFNPGSKWGSTSEAFATALKEYVDNNPDGLIKDKKRDPPILTGISKAEFQTLMNTKYMKSVVEPGEAVGIIAGQSVGEPSTQMTLNTFHLAGHAAKNVTLGIPRLKEIVMTASRDISTATMTMDPKEHVTEEQGIAFAQKISQLSLAELIDDAVVEETIGHSKDGSPMRTYDITLNFYPKEEYEEAYEVQTSQVARALEASFVPRLWKAIKNDFKGKAAASAVAGDSFDPTIGTSTGYADGHVPGGPGSGRADREGQSAARAEDASEDEHDPEDNDTAAKRQNRDADVYDTSEDEAEVDAILRKDSQVDDDELNANAIDEGYVGSEKADSDAEKDGSDVNDNTEKPYDSSKLHRAGGKQRSKEMEAKLRANIAALRRFEFNDAIGERCKMTFEFSLLSEKVLMLNLVETACRESRIRSIPGIGSAMFNVEKDKVDPVTHTKYDLRKILTEGVNLQAMHEYDDIIDLNRLQTNNIGAMLDLYGVEAARATIIQEMKEVFGGHGIAVDLRHLGLIADMMTRDGGFRGFNRGGLSNNASPFMKMSFETTLDFLRGAVISGDWDDLSNPSARIVAGKTSRVGTGAFDVYTPLDISGGLGGQVVEHGEAVDAEITV